MKPIFQSTIFLIVLLAVSNSYPVGSPVDRHGKLKVKGLQLVGEKGEIVQLRGMSTHGIQWFSYCNTPESFDTLVHDWKVNIIRLSMYAQEDGYVTNPTKYKALVDQYVDWCGQRGVYALIDWHMLTPGNPNDPAYVLADEFWDHMSCKHNGKKHVLYEICNEPNGAQTTWNEIAKYANRIIPKVRANDPNTVVIVGTPEWDTALDTVTPTLTYPNIMYSFHFYAYHEKRYDIVERNAGRIPLFVTEWGPCNYDGNGVNDFASSDKWLMVLNGENSGKQVISWCNWNFSDKYEACAVLNTGACTRKAWNDVKASGEYMKKQFAFNHDSVTKTVCSFLSKKSKIL